MGAGAELYPAAHRHFPFLVPIFLAAPLAGGVKGLGGVFTAFLIPRMKRSSAPGSSCTTSTFGFLAMPQPLSRVNPNTGILIANAGMRPTPLQQRPALALLAIDSIASWTNVETFMLNLFVSMLGGPTDTAARIYLALETQSAKSAAISVAAMSLSDDKQRILRAVLAVAKSKQKARDKLAHWAWGVAPAIEDGILLVNPRALIHQEIDRENVFVYKEQDFLNIIAQNERLCGFCQLLKFILGDHIGNRDGMLYAQLSGEPEIRERLNRPA